MGVDRKKWFLSKFLFQIFTTTFLIFLSYILCAYYTYFLFSKLSIYNTLASTLLYILYILFILSLTTFSSSLGNNAIQSAGIFFGIFILFNLLSIFLNFEQYNPMSLSSLQNQWIVNGAIWKDAFKNIIFTLLYSIILITIGIIYFDKQEL